MSSGLKTLHLSNGTIKFGRGFECIQAVNQLSTIRLTNMRLVVGQGVEPGLASVSSDVMAGVLSASGSTTSFLLEDCTLEASFDSPALDGLAGCMAVEGAHVGLVHCIRLQPSIADLHTHCQQSAQKLSNDFHTRCMWWLYQLKAPAIRRNYLSCR
jgi:hypothetical protein